MTRAATLLFFVLSAVVFPLSSAQAYTVSGYVAEFPPCSGRMRGVTVTLHPTGRTVQTSLSDGSYAFADVSNGAYRLTVSPGCNPFGCWLETPVQVAGADVQVNLCMVGPATATPTHTPTPPPPSLPDLFVAAMWVNLENYFGGCWSGSTALGLQVTVRNQGSAAAGSFVVEANGSLRQTVDGLAAQSERSLWFPAYVYMGVNTVIVDVDEQVTESNEANNIRSEWLAVPTLPVSCTPTPTPTPPLELPDLEPYRMSIGLEQDDMGCTTGPVVLGLRVDIRNNGPVNAGPFMVKANNTLLHSVSGLAAGSQIRVWFPAYQFPGENTVFVDSNNDVMESNEQNNILTQMVPIPTPLPTCTWTPTPCNVGPFIGINPETLTLTCQGAFSLTITNTGAVCATLHITGLELWHGYSQGWYGTGFQWDISGIVLPFDLAGGQSLAIPVTYQGSGDFPSRLHLRVQSDAQNEPDAFRTYFGLLCDAPTATPTPAWEGSIHGYVAEFPPCTGAMRGVTVTLLPLGWSVQTSLSDGSFAFAGVPPGSYTLRVSPGCNPFGCWPDTSVSVASHDVYVPICPNPLSDLDRDGLPDSVEADNHNLGPDQTNRDLPDCDLDGLLDGDEDTNHNGRADTGETQARNRDTDGDRYRDGIEVLLGTDPLLPDAGFADLDGDQLPDAADPAPLAPDQDGDRYGDGFEAAVFADMTAANDPRRYPRSGDCSGDGAVTNMDALLIQSYFLRLVNHTDPAFGPDAGFRFMELSGDGQASNIDALIAQSLFLHILPILLLP